MGAGKLGRRASARRLARATPSPLRLPSTPNVPDARTYRGVRDVHRLARAAARAAWSSCSRPPTCPSSFAARAARQADAHRRALRHARRHQVLPGDLELHVAPLVHAADRAIPPQSPGPGRAPAAKRRAQPPRAPTATRPPTATSSSASRSGPGAGAYFPARGPARASPRLAARCPASASSHEYRRRSGAISSGSPPSASPHSLQQREAAAPLLLGREPRQIGLDPIGGDRRQVRVARRAAPCPDSSAKPRRAA